MNLGQIVEEIDSSILVQRQQSYNISKNAVRKVLKQESWTDQWDTILKIRNFLKLNS